MTCEFCDYPHPPDACPVAFGPGDRLWLRWQGTDADDVRVRVVRLHDHEVEVRETEYGGASTRWPEALFYDGTLTAMVPCRICRETLVPVATNRPLCGRACASCESDAADDYARWQAESYEDGVRP